MKWIVKTIFNNDDNGRLPADTPEEDLPHVFHGPFETKEDAINWIDYVYPQDEMDVEEQYVVPENSVPDDYLINDPESLFDD